MHMAFAEETLTDTQVSLTEILQRWVHVGPSAMVSLYHSVFSQKMSMGIPRYPDVRRITTGYYSAELTRERHTRYAAHARRANGPEHVSLRSSVLILPVEVGV